MNDQRAVVFIHGLWIHSDAWNPWVGRYSASGYQTRAPGWPGDAVDVEQTRADPLSLAGHGVDLDPRATPSLSQSPSNER